MCGIFNDMKELPDYTPLKLDTFVHPVGAWLLLSDKAYPEEPEVVKRCAEILQANNEACESARKDFEKRVNDLQEKPKQYAKTPTDDVKLEVINPKEVQDETTVEVKAAPTPPRPSGDSAPVVPPVPHDLHQPNRRYVAVAVVFTDDESEDVLVNVIDAFAAENDAEDFVRDRAAHRFKNIDLFVCSMYEWLVPAVLKRQKTDRFSYREKQLDAIVQNHENTQRELSTY
ncbi:MAG: hypothetical protein CL902_00550 [Dehalococcoidia bacterium]|nr:hypothetical protein [Dehalococcoidia bacterium]